MRHLKTLTLAAMAVFALVAFAGAGTASATMLCTVGPNATCPAANTIPVGTTINGALKPMTVATLTTTGGLINPTIICSTSTTMVTVTNAGGGSAVDVAGTLDGLTFTNCSSSNPTGCSTSGTVSGLSQAVTVGGTGSANGTLSMATTPTVSFTCPGPFGGTVTCTFGGNNINGAVTGGNPAQLVFNATLVWAAGSFCPTSATWTATYAAQSPMTAIWVTNS